MLLKKNKQELIVFILFFLLHCLFIIPMKAPMIIDEYLTFTNASFLSGNYDWTAAYSSLPKSSYYGWGLSVFYIPLFLFSENIFLNYKLALVINAILMSFTGVLAVKIYKNVNDEKNVSNALGVALAVCSYGPYLYLSKGVWNESGLLFIPWLILFLLVKVYKRETKGFAFYFLHFALGFCSAYAYTFNGRGLALLVASVFVYICMLICQKKLRGGIAYFSAIGIVLFINKYICDYLVDNLIDAEESVINNINVNLMSKLSVISLESVVEALTGYFGTFFYIICASLGISILGLVLLACKLVQTKEFSIIKLIAGYSYLYLIIDIGQIFVQSYNRLILTDYNRTDYFMYGRYFDSAIPLCIFATILLVLECGISKKIIACCSVVFLILISTATKIAIPAMLENGKYMQLLNVGIINTLSLNKYFFEDPNKKGFLFVVIMLIMLFAVCVALLYKKKIVLFCAVLILFNIVTGYITMDVYAWPTSQSKYDNLQEYTSVFEDIDSSKKEIYYVSQGGRALNIQYALPEYSIRQLNLYIYGEGVLSAIEHENCFIMSNSDEHYETFIKECYKVNNFGSNYLWVYGDELKEELEAQGIEFEENMIGEDLTFVEYANSFNYTPLDSNNYRKCFRAMGTNSSYGASWYYLGTDSYLVSDPVKMLSGKYVVEVEGENLNAQLDIANSEGTSIAFDYAVEMQPNRIIYTVDLQEDIQEARLYIISNVSASLVDEDIMRVKRVRLYSK